MDVPREIMLCTTVNWHLVGKFRWETALQALAHLSQLHASLTAGKNVWCKAFTARTRSSLATTSPTLSLDLSCEWTRRLDITRWTCGHRNFGRSVIGGIEADRSDSVLSGKRSPRPPNWIHFYKTENSGKSKSFPQKVVGRGRKLPYTKKSKD